MTMWTKSAGAASPSSDFIDWSAGAREDRVERLRLLLGGMQGANTPFGPGIRDHLRDARREILSWTGLTAWAALGVLIILFLTASDPFAATYVDRNHVLSPGFTAPKKRAPAIRKTNETADYEEYSNGLVIMKKWVGASRPRPAYPVFPVSGDGAAQPHWQSDPAGIVYHSTESHPLPEEDEWHPDLPPIETYLLDYVRERHLYHFVIDRTGRVFRVVPESDVAYHAGKSVWGDDKNVYVNLNTSFLGIAFEKQAQHRSARVTPDQIQAARLLTEMLRDKYDIPAADCVTHAQVSVNPANMMIGYHTDWARNFPFEELGLTDNYQRLFAAMYLFGFDYDSALVAAAGHKV